MISPRVFILILTTLLCCEVAGTQPEKELSTALLSIGGIALGFGLLAKALALAELRTVGNIVIQAGRYGSGGSGARDIEAAFERFARKRRLVEILWCMTLPATLVLTGWAAALNHWESIGVPSLLVKLGLFLPTGLALILFELTTAQFEEIVGDDIDSNSLDTFHNKGSEQRQSWNEGATSQRARPSWQEHFLTRLRLGDFSSFLTCVGPVLAIAGFSDLGDLAGSNGLSTPAVVAFAVLGTFTFLCLYPGLLTRWVGAARLCESNDAFGLFHRLSLFSERLNIRGTGTHIIPSDGRWAGAAIVGWFPRCRKLWLGDALLEHLSAREIDMVIMHEFAHVLRKHFLWRIFPAIWALGVAAVVWMVVLTVGGEAAGPAVTQLASALLSCVTLFVGLGVMARATELDADRQACWLAVKACDWADSPADAAGELHAALSKLLGDREQTAKASWMHPSLAARLEQLHAIGELPAAVA